MQQIVQNFKTGELSLQEVPVPQARRGCLLVRTRASVISPGSEKSVMSFSKKSLMGKALARPDLVKQALTRARKEGFSSAFHHAMNRLDTPLPMGYSCCGEVVAAGEGSTEFKMGDRVALNGTGFAGHAEFNLAPFNVAARVPDNVGDEAASFSSLGAIALEGVRNAELTPGSNAAVFGLGLVGLLTVQLMRAYGYRVVGVDFSQARLELARQFGAEAVMVPDGDLTAKIMDWTNGYGVDASLICASTASNQPVDLSQAICRYRGRIVMVGVTGMELDRRPFYDKELSFVVSKSTGPGKGDPVYEKEGIDYPLGLVRWTEKRNMEEVLRLLACGSLDFSSLVSHHVALDKACDFYASFFEGKVENVLGTIITYPKDAGQERRMVLRTEKKSMAPGIKQVGLIGAGLFGKNVLYPVLQQHPKFQIRAVATATGISATDTGKKLGVEYVTTDYQEMLNDPKIDAVFVTTQDSSHAQMITRSLAAGKSVFTEKPLAATPDGLDAIVAAYREHPGEVMTGFCRRYSPAAIEMIRALQGVTTPKMILYRINAGAIPPEHWTQCEPGGRIVGEFCHFLDFAGALAGANPREVRAMALEEITRQSISDNFTTSIRFDDGSVGSFVYCAKGDKALPRELVEAYGGGVVTVNRDFRQVETLGGKGARTRKFRKRDLGYRGEVEHFHAVLSGSAPSNFERDVSVTRITFALLESLSSGEIVPNAGAESDK